MYLSSWTSQNVLLRCSSWIKPPLPGVTQVDHRCSEGKFSLPHLPRQCSMLRLAGKPDSHNCYISYLELVIQLKRPQKYVLPVRQQTMTKVFCQPLQSTLHGGFYVVGHSIRKRGWGGAQISQVAPNPVISNKDPKQVRTPTPLNYRSKNQAAPTMHSCGN